MKSFRNIGTIAAAALLAVAAQQPALAQNTAPNPVTCALAWCPIQVQVVKNTSGADVLWVSFNEIRLPPKYSGGTIDWKLVGSPDYEFRAGSVGATGANAMAAPAQFPLRLVSDTEYAYDDLNGSAMTFSYEIRVYKKGSPTGSAPLVSTGSVVNAGN